MAEGEADNVYQRSTTRAYLSAMDNSSQSLLPPITNSYQYDESGSWMFSSHDIPILIGAAAGAIGLIIIFLAAALIWHCCQFALQREKSSYSLDNESERNSVTSHNSNLYINNPISSAMIVDEKILVSDNSDQNIKRSISAPIHKHQDNSALKCNTQKPIQIKTVEPFASVKNDQKPNFLAIDDNKSNKNQDSISIGMELNDNKGDNYECHRSHIYLTNPVLIEDMTAFKSKSLPWSQSNKRRTGSIDDESQEEFQSKINFSKRRKNRMRNDSAAAIAMNRSGTDPNNKMLYSHKDTDTLVDNEAIVVYDERTAL